MFAYLWGLSLSVMHSYGWFRCMTLDHQAGFEPPTIFAGQPAIIHKKYTSGARTPAEISDSWSRKDSHLTFSRLC